MEKNLKQYISAVWEALGSLKEHAVLYGDACVPLYADRQTMESRPMETVSVLLRPQEELHAEGFQQWIAHLGFEVVDITKSLYRIDNHQLHFTNLTEVQDPWLMLCAEQTIDYTAAQANPIRLTSPWCFLAYTLHRFQHSGNSDGRTSAFIEDFIYILENRKSIWEEMQHANGGVGEYLRAEIPLLLQNPDFAEWVDCHVERGFPPATSWLLDNLHKVVNYWSTGQKKDAITPVVHSWRNFRSLITDTGSSGQS